MSLDVYLKAMRETTVYDANITHNLGEMASHARLYKPLWEPEKLGIKTAKELIVPLKKGLVRLLADPDGLRKFNPDNGWGTYEDLVAFVECYLQACEDNSDATISVWR